MAISVGKHISNLQFEWKFKEMCQDIINIWILCCGSLMRMHLKGFCCFCLMQRCNEIHNGNELVEHFQSRFCQWSEKRLAVTAVTHTQAQLLLSFVNRILNNSTSIFRWRRGPWPSIPSALNMRFHERNYVTKQIAAICNGILCSMK